MNQAIDAILGHYSVRNFEDKALTEEELALLIKSAQAASTSSFVQAYSIIGITDKKFENKFLPLREINHILYKQGNYLSLLLI